MPVRKTPSNRCLPLLLLALVWHLPGHAEETGNFSFPTESGEYPYTVKQTGDNYTFEFGKSPGTEGKKLKAAVHVLQSVYGDSSIEPSYSETFMKETAQCFVFDSRFYAYRACFLPNEYSPGNQSRFWGFVNRLPNAWWLITRNLLPALSAFAVFFWWRKQ